jgi:aminoglycoside/choline kinase family phosphotransferase
VPLAGSGSDRKYFRIIGAADTVIGVYNTNLRENDAFVGFTGHFLKNNLPVPEVYHYLPMENVYFLRDLGDTTLYSWLRQRPDISGFNDETKNLFRRILDFLVLFQVGSVRNLDTNLCYPRTRFDSRSMMWDMHYFKYMLLKLLSVPFDETLLEDDFNTLAGFLSGAGQDYFLYRDFQTANIMIVNGQPWFIDYQGGRMGAPQYDLASLLYDAKIPMSGTDREELSGYYINRFCSSGLMDAGKFMLHLDGFILIRLMQALGAFGYRGLYEQKPTFAGSVVSAVTLVNGVINNLSIRDDLPELCKTIRLIPETPRFKLLKQKYITC